MSGQGVRLASIHIYPMKAGHAVDLGHSLVEPWGVAGDRRWLLVDEDGRFVSQREEPSLARVTITCTRPLGSISVAPPWAEDRWRRVRIGTVPFRVAKPCGRCAVTTIDQATGERGSQPQKMLGRRRNIGQKLVFGQNLTPDSDGTIRAGDP
jgi:uncharacterized protein